MSAPWDWPTTKVKKIKIDDEPAGNERITFLDVAVPAFVVLIVVLALAVRRPAYLLHYTSNDAVWAGAGAIALIGLAGLVTWANRTGWK